MPIVMSDNPKRVRVFIKDGQVYEGGIEEYYKSRNNMGGTGRPNTVQKGTGETK